jgi:hypothetical protein
MVSLDALTACAIYLTGGNNLLQQCETSMPKSF